MRKGILFKTFNNNFMMKEFYKITIAFLNLKTYILNSYSLLMYSKL